MTRRAPIRYRIEPVDPSGHRFAVQLTVDDPDPEGQVLWLPTWIAGSYLIREFARNIISFEASGSEGPLAVERVDKHTWRLPPASGPVEVRIEVYAWDLSVRAAHLDRTHGFFNGTSVFLAVAGRESEPCEVWIGPPSDPACEGWRVATSLEAVDVDGAGFGWHRAADYEELVDHPVELGTFAELTFDVEGVPHRVAITGRHTVDGERLCRDLQRICTAQVKMFGGPPPMDRYVFLVMAVGDGYGGLEHRASTALLCSRDDLPAPGATGMTDAYRGFLGLCSHEYFHSWNVKRIRPERFAASDMRQEAYTTLLWAFEGITSYYDDLMLLRSGVIEIDAWLTLLGQTATRVWRASGRHRQSLADASFDAWVKFYRQDENAANALVSYYTKGALAGLALDLTLRLRTEGRRSLDDVMRVLWERHGLTGQGVPEGGVEAIAEEVAGVALDDFFDRAIRGTEDLPLAELLADFGLRFGVRPADSGSDKGGGKGSRSLAEARARGDLGAKVSSSGGGAKLDAVLWDGAAHGAGLSAGDVIIAMDGLKVGAKELVARCAAKAPGDEVTVHAFRRDELFTTTIRLGVPLDDTCWISLDDDAEAEAVYRRAAWLGGPPA